MNISLTSKDVAKESLKGLEKGNFFSIMKKEFNLDLRYRPEDLIAYSERLETEYPRGKKNPSQEAAIIAAIYFGETIVRNIRGAAWSDEVCKGALNLKIVITRKTPICSVSETEILEETIQVFPVQSLSNFFRFREKSLYEHFNAIENMMKYK